MSAIKEHAPKPLFDTLEHLRDHAHILRNIPEKYHKEYQLACEFLFSYRGSAATFSSYRREVERFLQWAWFVAQKSLKEIKRNDFELFVEFCQKPLLSWVGTKQVARYKLSNGQREINPEWRPFVASISKHARSLGQVPDVKNYAPSQQTLRALFAILGSFYTYLVQEDFVDINPIAQIRQKSKFLRKTQHKKVIRRLSELQWAYVIETTEQLAENDPAKHERTLFIMNALYGMYLRISELAVTERWAPQMGDFQRDQDGHWWFKTVGKANKERIISVSDAMLAALKRYRHHLGLSALPLAGETHPLLLKANGKGAISSTRQIRSIVQTAFDAAVQRLYQDGFSEEAEQLKNVTVHWLRHTGISDDVKHRPREHVRDDAGHGSSAITDRYIDIELRERHQSAKNKNIKPQG